MSESRGESAPGADDLTASRAAADDSRYAAFEGATEDFGIGPGDTDPLIGADIGGVTIVRLIGQGGMSRVYEARQAKPSRPVAVKVIRPGVVESAINAWMTHDGDRAVEAMQTAVAGMDPEKGRVARHAFLSRSAERERLRQRQRLDAVQAKLQPIVNDICRQAEIDSQPLDWSSPEYLPVRDRAISRRLAAIRATMSKDDFDQVRRIGIRQNWEAAE